MNTPDRKKSETVHTPDRMLNCCGLSTLFSSSESELREEASLSKLAPGFHIAPRNIDNANQFIWDHDSAPITPPESLSRSIDFSQLGSGSSKWPFRFFNEDLNFNQRSPVTLSPISRSPKGSSVRSTSTMMSMDSCSPTTIRNIAPAGLGQYDYHLGITRETSWFRSNWSRLFNNSRSSTNVTSKRRNMFIGIFLLLAIFSSSAILGLYRHDNRGAAALVNDDTSVSDVLSRKVHIRARILEANITSVEMFDDINSPQSTALEWLSNDDPLRLEPSDRGLIPRYASVVFYFSISSWDDGENEHAPLHWLSDKSICDWSGLTCIDADDNSQAVIGFEFLAGRVDGPLVREILVAFPDLEFLHLGGIGLAQQLPSDIGKLLALQVLSLEDNALTGTISEEIGKLKDLQVLGLQNNYLTNTIPLDVWTLPALAALYLDGNSLTGTIPVQAKSMESLIDLRLRDNMMNGTLDSLGNASQLQVCYLDTNSFEGTIPSTFGLLGRLESLTIYDNFLVSSVPSELGNLQVLKDLIVSDNGLTGTVPSKIAMLPMMDHLWLNSNYLTGAIPDKVCENRDRSVDIQVDCNTVSCSCCKNCTRI